MSRAGRQWVLEDRGSEMSGARRGTRVTITGRAAIGLPGRTPRRVATLLGLFLALTALAATLAAASASAAECYSGGSRCPGLAEDQHLTDADGIVMPTTTTYFVYWDPKGAPAYPAKYKSGIKTFFKGLEHDNGTDQNFYSVLTQYGVKYETHLGKTITDKDPYPAETSECSSRPSTPCISLVQIQAELKSLVKDNKLPGQVTEHGQESFFGPTKAYFILLPPGVSACDASREEVNAQGQKVRHGGLGCSGVQYCSLHDYSLVPTDELEDLPYAVLAYLPGIKGCEDPQRPNGTVDDELVVMEHEFAEMITDPFLTGWLEFADRRNRRGRGHLPGRPMGSSKSVVRRKNEVGHGAWHGPQRRALQPADRRPLLLPSAALQRRDGNVRAAQGASTGGERARARERLNRGRHEGNDHGPELREPDRHERVVREIGGERIHGELPDLDHGGYPRVHEHGRRGSQAHQLRRHERRHERGRLHIRSEIGRGGACADGALFRWGDGLTGCR